MTAHPRRAPQANVSFDRALTAVKASGEEGIDASVASIKANQAR